MPAWLGDAGREIDAEGAAGRDASMVRRYGRKGVTEGYAGVMPAWLGDTGVRSMLRAMRA